MFYSFYFHCIYHLINMKSSLTLLCLVVWVNVDASSAQTEVKCNVSLPPTRGTSYTPADRNLFLPDERVTVTCDSGFWNFFSRQTENTITCKEDGKWSSSTTDCEQYCGKPEGTGRRMEIPDQVLERYKNGNQIDYTCISPYKDPGGKATCKNGEWHMPVECNASCPDPPPITNGDFTKEKRDVEGVITEVSYQCSRQYTLSFTASIRCLNGKWPSPPKCL
uniref:Sushi domain-containing protein n=1 Tax=Oncorhynchus tshawytscha TaxID=74940 RepID=A0AAZ3SEX0_ONCTS